MVAQRLPSSSKTQLSSSRTHEQSRDPIRSHNIVSGGKLLLVSSSALQLPSIPLELGIHTGLITMRSDAVDSKVINSFIGPERTLGEQTVFIESPKFFKDCKASLVNKKISLIV